MVEASLLRDASGRGSRVVRDSCYDSVLRCRSREKSWDDALDHTAAWDPPIDPTEVRSSNEFVLQHLERLGSPASEVIRMKLFQDMSFEVVAEALEAPTGTVKGWYYRGLDRIRDWVSMEAAL